MGGGTRLKARIVIFVMAIIILIAPNYGIAEEIDHLNKLESLSSRALQFTNQGKYTAAKQILSSASVHFLNKSLTENTYSVSELHVLTRSYETASNALASPTLSHEQRVDQVLQFHLAANAVKADRQPIWLEMEGKVLAAFSEVEKAVAGENSKILHHNLNQFFYAYDILYPALLIDHTREKTMKMDAHIEYLERNRNTANQLSGQQIAVIKSDLKSLFNLEEDETDPSLLWVMISTSGFILLSLTYVGWKKYKAEKENKRKSRDY